jgi:hypothetical protein
MCWFGWDSGKDENDGKFLYSVLEVHRVENLLLEEDEESLRKTVSISLLSLPPLPLEKENKRTFVDSPGFTQRQLKCKRMESGVK